MSRVQVSLSAMMACLLVIPAFPKKTQAASQDGLAQITERGRLLYEYDQAAWHATDAVHALNPTEQEVGRYIGRRTDSGWVVAFGHLNETRDAFLVAYTATQGKSLQEFSVKHFASSERDTGFYLSAARAIDLALKDFQGEKRPYNAAVLPASSNQLYVYVIPAQTEDGVYPLGGDARFLISSDGNSIVERRRLHNDILMFDTRSAKNKNPQAGWHTHVLSDVPEDTDVFYVLTRKPSIPEYIGTRDKTIYVVQQNGTILLGK